MPYQSFQPEIPADTAQVAKSIFPSDNVYMIIGDNLQSILGDADFSCVYRSPDALSVSPNLLALVVVFQLMEGLADDQVSNNLQARIDWKYALHLSLSAPGIESATHFDFRQRLLSHQTGMRMFNRLMSRLIHVGLYYPWHTLNVSNGVLRNSRPVI